MHTHAWSLVRRSVRWEGNKRKRLKVRGILQRRTRVGKFRERHPSVTLNEFISLIPVCFFESFDLLQPGNPGVRKGAGAFALELGEEGGLQAVIGSVPRHPALGIDVGPDFGAQQHSGEVFLPWSAEECLVCFVTFGEFRCCIECATLEWVALNVQLWNVQLRTSVHLALRCVHVGLALHCGLLGGDAAVLDRRGSVAEDEVDGAKDCAVSVKLAVVVNVEGVRIAIEGALIEGGLVGAHSHRDGLTAFRSCCVADLDTFGQNPLAFNDCNTYNPCRGISSIDSSRHSAAVTWGWFGRMLTQCRGLISRHPWGNNQAASDDGLRGAVAEKHDIKVASLEDDLLIVSASLDVHHVERLAFGRSFVHRFCDCLEVSGAVPRNCDFVMPFAGLVWSRWRRWSVQSR